jgi:hypothetical protein
VEVRHTRCGLRGIRFGSAAAGNVILLTQGAAVMRKAGLTFADDNGLLPASANPRPQEEK